MTNEELKAQFEKCKEWRDPEQWDALGMEYYNRGYVLNAGYCFKQADEIRQARKQPAAQIPPAVVDTDGKQYAVKSKRRKRGVLYVDVVPTEPCQHETSVFLGEKNGVQRHRCTAICGQEFSTVTDGLTTFKVSA
jgi:hypothetical protein